jgi:predicted glycosyltransferase
VKVWIDLSNSPHALLFAPVARRLEGLGHTVFVTARDNAQTVELGRRYWPDLEVVGGESPPGRAAKARSLAERVSELRRVAQRERPAVALSHNSYAQIVAARLSGVRTVTAMDYEFQPANHVAFRAAARVLLPDALRASDVRRQGAAPRKTRYYDGLKEELYLGDFTPDPQACEAFRDTPDGRVLAVLRPPPSRALYHRFGNPLFEDVLNRLGRHPDVLCVVLPRHAEQREAVDALDLPSVVVPASAVDSRSLMYFADIVVGAGGTMTRESALLGTPTVTLFAGATPSVDKVLIDQGKLRRITSAHELVPPRQRNQPPRELQELAERRDAIVRDFVEAAGLG